ncbi:hypothetical protein M422DRAFT_254546 [Sphaerobolus stellatus SS14]|uniref:Uncharacterized protein n=1 Tax=Sphaerobolus stellatus (strain SS14) TaxID=990650 RepID=A0A0C9UHE5_SPHS4|nr:hypothetical protein M422DRAFT_254546 [Sphaerobolus stellatus SS14]
MSKKLNTPARLSHGIAQAINIGRQVAVPTTEIPGALQPINSLSSTISVVDAADTVLAILQDVGKLVKDVPYIEDIAGILSGVIKIHPANKELIQPILCQLRNYMRHHLCSLTVPKPAKPKNTLWASNSGGVDLHFPPNTVVFKGYFSASENAVLELGSVGNAAMAGNKNPGMAASLPNSFGAAGLGTLAPPRTASLDLSVLLTVSIAQIAQSQIQLMQKLPGSVGITSVPGSSDPPLPSLKYPSVGSASVTSESSIKPWIMYPKFDQFFKTLPDVDGRDTGAILVSLSDAGIYRIEELHGFSDAELKEEGLRMGDIKWLRKEVEKVLKEYL